MTILPTLLNKKCDSLQDETSVEPITNPTDKTKQIPRQIAKSSYSEIFTGQKSNPSIELQKQFPEMF